MKRASSRDRLTVISLAARCQWLAGLSLLPRRGHVLDRVANGAECRRL
jgi:hypothetical protein